MTDKTIAVIASTMRSGSTLLKALLAEADDVSNLPEMDFQKYRTRDAARALEAIDEHAILVLKRPCWYQEVKTYPRLPDVAKLRPILLVRDVYETVASLRKMTFRKLAGPLGGLANGLLAERYWAGVMQQLLETHDRLDGASRLVRYEDLVADPIEQTQALFEFLGSERTTGTDRYSKPKDYQWKWGKDDGGPNIKTLQVQPPRRHDYPDRKLLKTILASRRIAHLRQRLGYPDLPAL